MFELGFWFLFLLVYAGFSIWLAKTILVGIFRVVTAREAIKEPAVVMWTGGDHFESSERRLDQTVQA